MKKSPRKSRGSSHISSSSSELDSPKKKHKSHDTKPDKSTNVQVRVHNTDSFTTYHNKNEHLTIDQTALPTQFGAERIPDDAEVWLCEIPHGIDVKELIGKSIKLGGTSKTISTQDGQQLECVSEVQKIDGESNKTDRLSLVVQDANARLSIKNVEVHGRLSFRQKLADDTKEPLEIEDNISYKAGTDFPTELRVRHPLYGFQFDQFIELDEKVKQKLSDIANDNTKSLDAPERIAVKTERDTPIKRKKRKASTDDEDCVDASAAVKRPKIKSETETATQDLDWIRQI